MELDFTSMTERIKGSSLNIKSGKWRAFGWFLLTNAMILLSLAIISSGALIGLFPYVLLLGCAFPFIALWFSRWRAKRSHSIHVINVSDFRSEEERSLYELVESIGRKAGLAQTPQIGVYDSEEVNAFATGATRNRSLVAFSSGLIDTLDERAIAAVAAHEIAHIANGDMVTLSLVQSVVNTIVLLCTLPLRVLGWLAFWLADRNGEWVYGLITAARWLITVFLVFLGSLAVKAFSRRREFEADRLAGELIDREAMVHALDSLRSRAPIVLRSQKAFAAFRINGEKRWLDLFSDHPSIERRIARLRQGAG
ncbi:zinc metalloprotease HtpX [Cohnella fermenti]|uniref:Protease HtpX n=1 Tax=Cohnella fermenti TaxID=2565925 RepID=A0A4S4BTD5_9BACL|nr:zinc metalloprotease HtpX [Cohnella fermenti]THF77545.1 protease HtpX [Cohnella fermenti]